MVVDGHRRGLDVDHPPAVGGEHAVVGRGSEVDRLVDLVDEGNVMAGRVARVVGGDELGGRARRLLRQRLRAQTRRSGRSRGAA